MSAATISVAEPASFVQGSTIYINNTAYLVFSIINSTHLRIFGNLSFSSNNWSWQQAPFIDVNGPESTARGYSWSQDGQWQWVAVPMRSFT